MSQWAVRNGPNIRALIVSAHKSVQPNWYIHYCSAIEPKVCCSTYLHPLYWRVDIKTRSSSISVSSPIIADQKVVSRSSNALRSSVDQTRPGRVQWTFCMSKVPSKSFCRHGSFMSHGQRRTMYRDINRGSTRQSLCLVSPPRENKSKRAENERALTETFIPG